MENLILPNQFVHKRVKSLEQQLAMFTVRSTFTVPVLVNGEYRSKLTGHSKLYEVDAESGCINHQFALEKLISKHRDELGRAGRNITKLLLIENVTDTIVWVWYGTSNRYNYKINYERRPDGNVIVSDYIYYQGEVKEGKWLQNQKAMNLIRDHKEDYEQQLHKNYSWHQEMWRSATQKQITRETKITEKENPPGSAIHTYNSMQIMEGLSKLKNENTTHRR